jgi:hypothetical protein
VGFIVLGAVGCAIAALARSIETAVTNKKGLRMEASTGYCYLVEINALYVSISKIDFQEINLVKNNVPILIPNY